MKRTYPEMTQVSEEGKKIYYTLDKLLEDIILLKDNNVLLRFKLGNTIISEYPIHCDIVNNEVIITKI